MSYTYLQEQGEESSAECYSDIPASVLSRSRNTREKSCCSDSETESCQGSQYGMTSAPLTENRGEGVSMLSLVDSPVKTSAPLERAQDWPASDPVFGLKWPESSAKYDRSSSSWRIHPCLFPEDSMSCSATLPRWGMMRGGELSVRTMPAHLTSGIESGLWRTPAAKESGITIERLRPIEGGELGGMNRHFDKKTGRMAQIGLTQQVQAREMWKTPVADDAVNRDAWKFNSRGEPKLSAQVELWPTPRKFMHKDSGYGRGKSNLGEVVAGESGATKDSPIGGQLNPPWVAWLMGWPIEWTDSKPLAMDKFQQWRRSHGDCSEGQ